MKVQAGDVVHVRAVVTSDVCDADGDIHLEVQSATRLRRAFIREDQIVHLEPRPLQVGDKVICPSMSRATVAALGDGFTWVKYDDGSGYSTCDTSSLERVPA